MRSIATDTKNIWIMSPIRRLVCLLIPISASAQTPNSWKAGAAKVAITPTESIWMAGHGAHTMPSEGVQTDLYLKALALDDGTGRPSVLVTSDLVGACGGRWLTESRSVAKRSTASRANAW